MRRSLACLLAASGCMALAAPPVELPDELPGAPGRTVPPNLLVGLSLTYHAAAAAYPGAYDRQQEYQGYFNPRLCYGYPVASRKRGAAGDPDLSAERGFFTVLGRGDARRQCGAAFSGNFLNWAAMSRLDLLRLGLTGGDRFIDTPGETVLQRAVLPAGPPNEDFYAHPVLFPRRTVADAAGLTPFGEGELYVVSCRERILFSRTASGSRCDAPRRGKSGRLLVSDKRLGEYAARVRVCDRHDAADRPALCRPYRDSAKPQGVLQELAPEARIGVISYLTGRGVEDRNLYGGVLRAPLRSRAGEWNAVTGVLARDPDDAGTPASGAINYINRLGRDGVYKAHAPTAELYYEAVRYLQGRAPEAEGAGSDGGFPVVSARADPLLQRCQRNAIAIIGAAFGAQDRYLPGNRITSFLDRGRGADSFAPGASFDVMEWTERAGREAGWPGLAHIAGGADGAGSTFLAGAARWAGSQRIRSDADGPIDTLALQLLPEPGSGANPLALAAGPHFFDGSDAGQIPALAAQTLRRALVAGGAVSSAATAAQTSAGQGFILVASYDPSTWSGDLVRLDTSDGRVAAMPAWSAAARMPEPAARRIFTSVPAGAGASATVPFQFPQAQLDADLVAYLRGDRSKEGRGQRVRGGPLGDIVRSTPLVIAAPSAGVQGAGYRQFREQHSARRALAYVGANDGMLHAFDVETGVERFAYVPRALHGALPQLARPDYRHRAYVDASPGAGEALAGDTWRTVLVSGYGMGARGVFSIAVPSPDAFASGAGEMWQFSERDDRHIGHVTAAPAVARFRTATRNGEAQYRYFAVVASGWNNYGQSDAPDGALFLLALDKPQGQRWRLGSNYYRIEAPAADAGQPNALGPPAVLLGPDGSVRYVYAGDLQGRLWRFDFSGNAPWRNAASPLFAARDGDGRRQPISSAPRVVFGPGGGHLVLFGTGSPVQDGAGPVQTFYAVHDTLAPGQPQASRGALTARRLERGGSGFRVTGPEVDYASSRGWYFDLPVTGEQGEQVTATPVADGGAVVVASTVPPPDACSAPATRTYVLSALTGMAYDGRAGPGSGAGPVTGMASANAGPAGPLMILSGTSVGTRDGTGRATAVRRYSFVPAGRGGEVPAPVEVTVPARRLSWREIANWPELHQAATRVERP